MRWSSCDRAWHAGDKLSGTPKVPVEKEHTKGASFDDVRSYSSFSQIPLLRGHTQNQKEKQCRLIDLLLIHRAMLVIIHLPVIITLRTLPH
jgi:hypothetical protein